MKKYLLTLLFAAGCHHTNSDPPLVTIQIQDRNQLTETINHPERLASYEAIDFLSSQPYKKVLRVFKKEGKNFSKITTYHSNGVPWKYLEAEEMRANGAYREWFSNGQLKIEAQVIGGTADVSSGSEQDWLFEGVSRVFDDQGRIVAQITYEKGALEGPSFYYFPTGQLEKEIHFVKNKMEGDFLEYHLDGSLKSKTAYHLGLKNGESVGYFENTQTAWVEEYQQDLLQEGTYFDENGKPLSEIKKGFGFQALFENQALLLVEYRAGLPEGMIKKFNPLGQLQKSYSIKNGLKKGEEIEYYLSSELLGAKGEPSPKLSVMWQENKIHGTVKTWYPNGTLESQREYSCNQKQGPSMSWYADGSLMLLEEYEGDNLIKGQYYRMKGKESISTVFNGSGVATLHDESGSFLRKITYSKGKPIDPES